MTKRLAIIATHPIQYLSPWYRYLANTRELAVHVFYLWDFGVTPRRDPGFERAIEWDLPLLSGYDYSFVPNRSRRAGTHRTLGLWNPSIVREVRDWRPDAVLLFGYKFASLLYLILSWPRRAAPLLFRGDSHRLVKRTGIAESMRRRLIAFLFRRFDAFLYVGSANRDYFRYHQVPENKLFFAPHSVDNERFFAAAAHAGAQAGEWRSGIGIPAHHAVVLFAGKLEPKKRPLDLLSAFVDARLEDASLLFVGSGPLEGELRAAARGNPNIHFAPFQNQTLMPRAYAAADLLVLPSYGPYETWGLAVNEAMCLEKAVIASDHVGCAQDLIRPGENGLVFPAGDVAALSRCLQEALSDCERLRAWGKRGREVIERFGYEQTSQGLMKALASLGVL